MNPYTRIFSALNKARIRYLVVGGVAMNLLGYSRFTGDIDVLLALDQENLRKMAALMQKLDYEKRQPISIDELGDEKKVLKLMKEKHLTAFTFSPLKGPPFNIDIIVGESLQFEKYAKSAVSIRAAKLTIPVISIDDLIGMKKKSPREKDALDVAILLEFRHEG
ncbi:MAG: hypothetical protein Greene101449_87 [Candidatus Peregrinibacteria bacterium Greene1014_49]|nr:MAG: hypothetical protein Greene101449_87 [Candidatus Peregrinibacteria bacterium Greene1014_49]